MTCQNLTLSVFQLEIRLGIKPVTQIGGEEDFVCQKLKAVTGRLKGIGFSDCNVWLKDGFKVGVLDYNAETAEKGKAVELSADKAFGGCS